MKTWRWLRWIILLCVLLVVAFLVALSIKYDIRENGDATTTIAGLWSALATGILGLIAVWQNMRYKKLSDMHNAHMVDIASVPELCLLGINKPFPEDKSNTVLYIGRSLNEPKLSINLQVLDKAIIDLSIEYLFWFNEKGLGIGRSQIELLNSKLDENIVLQQNQVLVLNIDADANDEITRKSYVVVFLKYQNIYRDEFLKRITFTLTQEVNSLSVDKVKSSRAIRSEYFDAQCGSL